MTSLLEDVKRYVGFDAEDARVLAELRPTLSPHFARIAEHFYSCILAHPVAHASITGGTPQVERLKRSLVAWMDSGLAGPHDVAFFELRAHIGRKHLEVGLPQQYVVTAVGVMRQDYQAVLWQELGADATRHARALLAIERLFDVELAIMLDTYRSHADDRQRASLNEKLTAIAALAAGLAHEIRNPLNAASLQLHLLGRRVARAVPADQLPALEAPLALVQDEIERLSRLVSDFLAFARPNPLQARDEDLGKLMAEIVALESEVAREHGLVLELLAPGDPVVVELDAERIKQVALNLVRNAIEAARTRVVVEIGRDGDGARVRVRDDGAGIKLSDRERIFEPFFTTKPAGTGLGMAIVHSLVQRHGGTIELRCEGVGTDVVITLPRRIPPD